MANTANSPGSIISLPNGGGALKGIGEKFSPDPHTGTGNFTVPIAVPPGRYGFQPQLSLVYSTGNGNGPFGLGWSLTIPGVSRKTSDGVPRYNEAAQRLDEYERRDVFILSGAEDLVRIGGSYPGAVEYRPRTEGLFASIIHHHDPDLRSKDDYWEVASKDGLVSCYGTRKSAGDDPAVVARPNDPGRIFSWKLTETRDPFGNRIVYDYHVRDSGNRDGHTWDQPWLSVIRYGEYGDPLSQRFLVSVAFEYEEEERPDAFSDYRSGFEIRTTRRCRSILVKTTEDNGAEHNVRKYGFTYQTDPRNGVSLLQQIDIIGFDDHGNAYDGEDEEANPRKKILPPLTFGYTTFKPEKRRFDIVGGGDLPSGALGAADLELVDLHGGGLPDLVEMNGTVRFWRNLGNGRFDMPRPMREAPPHSLADPGVQMIDANGDGRMDLLVTTGPLAGYYPLTHSAGWDRKSFQRYNSAPSFNLDDPEVRLVDLDGDGYTDILRSGSRLECFFNDPDPSQAWQRTNFAPRQTLDTFPNVNFSDPRVKLADMTGDGLQDIVLIHDGNVEYWPNLGHGDWGQRISMRNGPRFPFGYDARRILIGDVDGDGLADIVYVDDRKVTLWLNHSGNQLSKEPIEILGTPPVTDTDNVRLVDLYGTSVAGVLWSSDATRLNRDRMMFLDFTGGQKPYLLDLMDNHMGAVTRVEYKPSTFFYLEDYVSPNTRWRTPLPFPVQVVARVEAIDGISKGKLATGYKYHHGYWDGAEREFRGFGMVEQFDTETIVDYHGSELHGGAEFKGFVDPELEVHFSPPTLTRTWFHQGPVGEEGGDWQESDYTNEYWSEDPQLLDHIAQVNSFLSGYNDGGPGRMPSPRNRRIKRDALRTLRGSILRTESYTLDGSSRADRPYIVNEHAYSLREESTPDVQEEARSRIFFPHLVAQRTTNWDRGDDPMTQFAFTSGYDAFGQPTRQTAVAMPRLASKRTTFAGAVVGVVRPDEVRVLATHTRTKYAASLRAKYIHDRIGQVTSLEDRVDAQADSRAEAPDLPSDPLEVVLRKQWILAQQVHDAFSNVREGEFNSPQGKTRVFSHVVNHYDGDAFEGLGVGQLHEFGALTRSETLVLTEEILSRAYSDGNNSRRPGYLDGAAAQPDIPAAFGSETGYRKTVAGPDGYLDGWYADTQRKQFDFQAGLANPRGLVVAMQDALGNETRIEEYEHQLLPRRVRDAARLAITARYNYRVLQPERMTDPNNGSTVMLYNPIGLPEKQYVMGIDGQGNETLGGTEQKPEISFFYDFRHFERTRKQTGKGLPIFVHTTRRSHHASDNISDETIEGREYSDGLGRLIQIRSQAEEWLFGEAGDDVGLIPSAGATAGRAIAKRGRDRVVVSGWQVFDNKGRVIEKYEPFFSQGLDFEPEKDTDRGQRATVFYDLRGNAIRTINPDGSQQRVIHGKPVHPNDLSLSSGDLASRDVPASFEPTPWETYTYDANDLADLTHRGTSSVSSDHHFTPTSGINDALGRVLCQVQRNGQNADDDWFITRKEHDFRGNPTKIVDALNRGAFIYSYDLLNRSLRIESIDAGVRTSVLDAQGNLIEYRDSKGSLARRTYDNLNRQRELWARDGANGDVTLRERFHYGDDAGNSAVTGTNTLGRLVKHFDEGGLVEMAAYDFKGNLLEKSRRTIDDTALSNGWLPNWSQTGAEDALEATVYQSGSRYDALNRPTEVTYPRDVDGERKKLTLRYNRAGALEAISLGNDRYVEHIAYNARGQQVLIAYGNGIMSRYAYDSRTFRLARLHTQRFTATVAPNSDIRTWTSAGTAFQDFAYGCDLAGNITRIDERRPNCGVANSVVGRHELLRTFGYDPLYRLATATGRACTDIGTPRGLEDDPRCGFFAGGAATVTQNNAPDLTEAYTERFKYDPAGNALELDYQASSGSWKRVFGMGELPGDQWRSAPNNRLTTLKNGSRTPVHSYRFDDNGNLVQQNTERHHAWDHADRMVAHRVQPQGAPASIETRYLYAADGMRVKKWVRNQQRQVKTTVYIDSSFEYHRKLDTRGERENNSLHVMDGNGRVALVRVGAPLDARDASPQVQYQLGDHLGSSQSVVGGGDARANSFINCEEYFPFGESSFGSFAKKRYRYAGKERDEESGLYYYGARYYAPCLARWMSCDPARLVNGSTAGAVRVAGNPQKLSLAEAGNSYAYAAPNPLAYLDPDGNAVYMVIYARGKASETTFELGAQTRVREIESSAGFEPAKDKVFLFEVQDLGKLKEMVAERALEARNQNYGKTVEVSFYSHTGQEDGPRALQRTSGGLQAHDLHGRNQLSLHGWKEIDFNWAEKDTVASFYGCHSLNFAKKFGEIQPVQFVAGQPSDAYPSQKADRWDSPIFGFSDDQDVYWVGGTKGELEGATFGTAASVPLTVMKKQASSVVDVGYAKPNFGYGEAPTDLFTATKPDLPRPLPRPMIPICDLCVYATPP